MYEWLQDTLAKVKTPKFFIVKPMSASERELVDRSEMAAPESFREFVKQFGSARLYRKSNYHLIRIFEVPRDEVSDDGQDLLWIGTTDSSRVYYKMDLLLGNEESNVFEWRHGQGFRNSKKIFSEWIELKSRLARKRYRADEWKKIINGPEPFSDDEEGILAARRLFDWKVVGKTNCGNVIFEITNQSDITIPFLSINVKDSNQPDFGGIVFLPVSKILPGNTMRVEKDCYREYLGENANLSFSIELNPGPEDRNVLWEFRT